MNELVKISFSLIRTMDQGLVTVWKNTTEDFKKPKIQVIIIHYNWISICN